MCDFPRVDLALEYRFMSTRKSCFARYGMMVSCALVATPGLPKSNSSKVVAYQLVICMQLRLEYGV